MQLLAERDGSMAAEQGGKIEVDRFLPVETYPKLFAAPYKADAIVNTDTAIRIVRRPPSLSPTHPEVGINTAKLTKNAIATVSTASGRVWNFRPNVGSATLKIVVSMMLMNIADT